MSVQVGSRRAPPHARRRGDGPDAGEPRGVPREGEVSSAFRVAGGVVASVATIVVVVGIRWGGSVAPMKTTGTVTSDDGTAIAFTKLGHGPPLILVDGALC